MSQPLLEIISDLSLSFNYSKHKQVFRMPIYILLECAVSVIQRRIISVQPTIYCMSPEAMGYILGVKLGG